MTVYTERLMLRRFTLEDAYDCFAFLSDEKTCKDDGGYAPYTEMNDDYWELMKSFLKQNRYMIELKKEHKVIGTIHLMKDEQDDSYEIGYVLTFAYRRKGYAFEALNALIDTLFQNKDIHELKATCYDYNQASIRLLEKLGFKVKGQRDNFIDFILDSNVFVKKGRCLM